jgi:hypothetical protein
MVVEPVSVKTEKSSPEITDKKLPNRRREGRSDLKN